MNLVRRLAVLLFMLLAEPARAHDALPIALTLDQTGQETYVLRALFPPAIPKGFEPRLDIVPPCRETRRDATLLHFRCPADVSPAAIALSYPGPVGNAPTVMRLSYLDGQKGTVVAPPGQERLELPDKETAGGVFSAYFTTGLQHIMGGIDHLLFLVCLVLLAGTPRRIIFTVTGFTLGHALTICLASLGLVMVNSGAVEVLIALSIVFAAAEVAKGRSQDLAWRKPALVASLFGLLHGLGFAGALAEIGLPQSEVPVSLLAFNLGIEVGQLIFVAALGLLMLVAGRLAPNFAAGGEGQWATRSLVSWPIGFVAAFFFFDRLLG